MRPVQIVDLPVTEPYVCAKCGIGTHPDRRHFVDLGINSDFKKAKEGMIFLSEGVIYLCNMCMMSLIGDYLGKLFEFINSQESSYNLGQQQIQDGYEKLHKEIFELRTHLDNRDDELKEVKAQLAEYQNTTAQELMEKVLSGRNSEDDVGSDSNTERTDKSSDGNDSAVESPTLTSESLFELNLAIAHGNNP